MDENFKNKKLPLVLEREIRKGLDRPSWESSNEGIHEKVNFDDTIWGFNLAGGAYYDTPLRITQVKPNSRAERAGIKVGDILRSINDVDTSTLTVQEAHDVILDSGLQIKLSLAAPDVEEPAYYVYEDELEEEIRERKRLELEAQEPQKIFKGAKVNDLWSDVWPCNKKRDIMYRESNCFMVPSKYEQRIKKLIEAREK